MELAEIYEKGEFFNKELNKALKFYEKAKELGVIHVDDKIKTLKKGTKKKSMHYLNVYY